MDAEGVEVFHACHGEAVVVSIADDFKFYFLPTLEAFFYEHLGSESEGALSEFLKLLFVLTDT